MPAIELTVDEKGFVAGLEACIKIARDVFGVTDPSPKLVLALSDLMAMADDGDGDDALHAAVDDLKRSVAIARAAFGDKGNDPEVALEVFVRLYGEDPMADDTDDEADDVEGEDRG